MIVVELPDYDIHVEKFVELFVKRLHAFLIFTFCA